MIATVVLLGVALFGFAGGASARAALHHHHWRHMAVAPARASVHRPHWQTLAAAPVRSFVYRRRWLPMAVNWTAPEKDAALVIDGETGKVLYSRNAEELRHPASLTKMMTLYLLFEQLKRGQMTLATPLPISEHASIQAPTKLHVRPGSTVPVETAIEAVVVLSANDIAVAIAEAVGGSESNFAELMTAKARTLGMTHTFYHNASGLPDELQITTAGDLSILARHLAYDFPQYFHYFSTPSFSYRGITHFTHDNLIGRYDGADGIKTGYTNASGFNLVSSVVRNGAHVIGVVMGGVTARRRDVEMIQLLDTTFASINQNPQLVARANVPWEAIASNSLSAPVIAGFQLPGNLSILKTRAAPPQMNMAIRGTFPAGADDEDAAESRPDPELDTHKSDLSGSAAASTGLFIPPARSGANAPPKPPENARVAFVLLPQPLALRQAAIPPAAPAPAFVPQDVAPLPKPPMMVASYQPQTVAAPAITPKPRAASSGRWSRSSRKARRCRHGRWPPCAPPRCRSPRANRPCGRRWRSATSWRSRPLLFSPCSTGRNRLLTSP